MNKESFSEIFTYIGEAPEHTPEEKKEIEELVKRARADIKRQIAEMEKESAFQNKAEF
ncbi:hypothetical protein LJC08_00615 [Methanimicrococcus sp. OttesenSCG-928-J09]|nr:hypothetical protein [Methanimicrococcus sp. OttesenSCG-928-J09]